MKKYTLIVSEDDNGALTISDGNDGFNRIEMVGILEQVKHRILSSVEYSETPAPVEEVKPQTRTKKK